MTSQEIQRALTIALGAYDGGHGANHFDLAAEVDQAPFRVRAELRELRRQRLVREVLTPAEHVWMLTARGWEMYFSLLRQTLPMGGAS